MLGQFRVQQSCREIALQIFRARLRSYRRFHKTRIPVQLEMSFGMGLAADAEFGAFETPSLYELFLSLRSSINQAERSELVAAIIVNPELRYRLSRACTEILGHGHSRRDMRADLKQQSFLKLIELFSGSAFPFCNRGPRSFGSWISKLIDRLVRREYRVLRSHRSVCDRRLRAWYFRMESVANSDLRNQWEWLAELIELLSDPVTKKVMRDWYHCYSLEESAIRQKIAVSSICKRRHAAILELHRMLRAVQAK